MLEYLLTINNQLLPEPHASLLAGMLFGVRADMPEDFYTALIITGTLHVIALSGMNISIIIRVLFAFLSSLLGKILSVSITVLAIAGFVLLVGPSATIVRAAIMGGLSMFAVLFGRKDIPLISLVLAVVTMILINNEVISSVSFQLSVFATLGILLLGGSGYKSDVPGKRIGVFILFRNFIRDDLRVSLSAQVFTVPLILFYFQRISLISPLANVATGWLVAPITYLGFATLFLASIWWPLGRISALITWVPLSVFIWVVKIFSHVPFASIEVGGGI